VAEADLINRYFERNHAHRGGAFEPATDALAFVDGPVESCDPWVRPLECAYGTVGPVCGGGTATEYLSLLSSYGYVAELSHGWATHHVIGGTAIAGADYRAQDPQTIGLSLLSCHTCNFLASDCLGSTIVLNPYIVETATPYKLIPLDQLATSTLVVFGYSYEGGGNGDLWRAPGAGRCFGEGFKNMFNRDMLNDMLLLGDGSLKAQSVRWTGGGVNPVWSDGGNWDSGAQPGEYDHVRISGPEVEVDVGAPTEPAPVWSIDLWDGAGITLPANRGLALSGCFLGKLSTPASTVTLEAGSSLQLSAEGGLLGGVSIIMPDHASGGTTVLSAAGEISTCPDVQVGENCSLAAACVDGSAFYIGEGTFTASTVSASDFCVDAGSVGSDVSPVESISASSVFQVHGGGQVWAASITNSSFDVPQGTVHAGTIGADFTVVGQGNVIADVITGSSFEVGTGGHVHANEVRASDFTVNLGGSVDAGAVTSCVGTQCPTANWVVDQGLVTAGDTSLGDNWTVIGPASGGPQVTLARASADALRPVKLELDSGAEVLIQDVPSSQPVFPDGFAHRLAYAGDANLLQAGEPTTASSDDTFYVGDHTRISGTDAQLEMDLYCGLDIAFVFPDDEALGTPHWDSSGVDITLEPVAAGSQEQVLELVSADTPAVFVDVPSDGKFGTLDLPAGAGAAVVTTADVHNNHASNPSPDDENGIFRTVIVGAGRVLRFATGSQPAGSFTTTALLRRSTARSSARTAVPSHPVSTISSSDRM
jgi:hypothetical protein